jgi:uncharacterized protein (TIGR03083 family)
MTDTDSRVTALRASHDRLRAVVGPLTPEQLRGRGYPSEWTIAQVLSHIGSGAEINGLIFDAAVAGAEAPKPEAFQAVWDVWNAKSPDAQAADALTSDAVLVEKIETLADPTVTFSIWSGPADVGGFAASRLGEHAVHVWDVEVVIDPAATIAPAAAEIILAGVAPLVGFTGKPGPAGRIHVTTTDPAAQYALVLGEKTALEPWDGGAATGTLTLPAEAFLRLLYGRLDADHTPPLAAEGIALDTLRATFPGF